MRASILRPSVLGNLGAVIRNDGQKITSRCASNSTVVKAPSKSPRKPKPKQKHKTPFGHTHAWSNALGMLTLKGKEALPSDSALGKRASRLERVHEKQRDTKEMTVTSQIVESELLRARSSLLQFEKMIAFRSNDRFFRKLQYILLRSPYSHLREMALGPKNLHIDISTDYREATRLRHARKDFHTARAQYGHIAATRNPFRTSLMHKEDLLDDYIDDMIESPKSIAARGLATKFREFRRHFKYYKYVEVGPMFNETATILVRRALVSPSQAIFNAEYHRFATFRTMHRYLCVFTIQWWHPYKQDARYYKFSKEQQQAVSTTLAQFSECGDKINRIYSYRVLPLLQRRLALEPPATIARQYDLLPKYWKSHWQLWRKSTAQDEQNHELFQREIRARTNRKVFEATIHARTSTLKKKNKGQESKDGAKSNKKTPAKKESKDGEKVKKQPLKKKSRQLEKEPA